MRVLETRFDVVVVGGGPAGLAFSLALAGSSLRVAIVERQPLAALTDPIDDGREIALTHRSRATLERLGAWARIDPASVSPMLEARVLNGTSTFALSFASDGRADRLGQLVANRRIRRALYQGVAEAPNLRVIAGASVVDIAADAAGATVTLGDGRRLGARLLVAADARLSTTRERLGIGAQVLRPDQSLLVARVAHPRDHGNAATEWFGHGQSIAMLPLVGRRSSAVLTMTTAEITRIAALPAAALGAELTRRYEGRLGAMTVEEGPHVYPLVVSYAHHFAATRAGLIGDAAVGMHPVTAHGFNLGLQGATALAALVGDAARRDGDIGGSILLRRDEAAHRLATGPLYAATNAIVGLYMQEGPVARLARFATLRAGARLPFVRRAVADLLMQR